MRTPLVFEIGSKGRTGVDIKYPALWEEDFDAEIPESMRRKDLEGFPEVSEPELVRHYTRLSQKNVGVDSHFYPLGSCTMKYNPRVNESVAAMKGFAGLHPATPKKYTQGILKVLYEMEKYLCEICGMAAFTLQPVAGAHGELTGLKVIKAAVAPNKKKVLIPTSAHGTNPASAVLAGFEPVAIEVGESGILDAATVAKYLDENTAALMMTNPNTLGLFESNIGEIAKLLHEKGAYLYCDGANLNAFVGVARPGDMGVDVLQTNIHKTFSAPHGGGGPGSGPVGVSKELEQFLPVPRVVEHQGKFTLSTAFQSTIGRMHSYYGNIGVLLRGYCYVRSLGSEGLREVAETAALNANYLRVKLEAAGYNVPHKRFCLHEFVMNDANMANKIITLDIAKRLIDKGYHPMTIYFPLIVHGAMLVEPTETETKETLDEFVVALAEILEEAKTSPELLHDAPHNTSVRRIDDVSANRPANLNVRWTPKK